MRWLNQSVNQNLNDSGWFSAGDEPDGSGKFIAAVLRNPAVTEAVRDLLYNRDGLMIGICNGFQALIKVGLLPYGDIKELTPEAPTLTFNTIGRHVSAYANTRVVSNRSPWLSRCSPGEVYAIPVSHGEGRFVATAEVLDHLKKSDQICTQYVNLFNSATTEMPANPNGSALSIEGICSPDGRIFGRMGHSERFGRAVAINLPGQRICRSLSQVLIILIKVSDFSETDYRSVNQGKSSYFN